MATVSDINTKIDAAIAAAESGDYANALKYAESAWMVMLALPDAEKEKERLEWSREGLERLVKHLRQKLKESLANQSGDDGTGVVIRPATVTYKRG